MRIEQARLEIVSKITGEELLERARLSVRTVIPVIVEDRNKRDPDRYTVFGTMSQ